MANYHRNDQRVRVLHALQLRVDGYTWQEVADSTQYWKTEAGARNAVHALLDKWESESVEQYRVIQGLRYERVLGAWFRPAVGYEDRDGEYHEPDEKAAGVVLKVMEGINRLHNLNKADPNEGGPRMSPEEFQTKLAEAAALMAAAANPGEPR